MSRTDDPNANSPTDLVGVLVERVRNRPTADPMIVLVEVLAEVGEGVALLLETRSSGRLRASGWARGGDGAGDRRLRDLAEVIAVPADRLRALVPAPAYDEVVMTFGCAAVAPPVGVAFVEHLEDPADPDGRWLAAMLGGVVDTTELRRAVSTATLLRRLSHRVDALSATGLMAQVEAASRQDEAGQAERAMDRIGAVLGHEVRDALRNVMGWSRLAAASDLAEPVRIEMVRKIQRAASQATAAVGDALEVVREGQAARIEQEVVELDEVLSWATDILHQQIAETRAVVRAGTLPTVHSSPTMFRLAIVELLRNCLDHGGRFVEVSVSATSLDGVLELSIEDNGPGMDEDARTNAFQPGFSTGVGTGYGLNRVRDALAEAGGTVRIEPRDTGGTRVVLAVPTPTPEHSILRA